MAIFSVKKYLPKLDGTALIRAEVYHGDILRCLFSGLALAAYMLQAGGCSDIVDRRVEIVRVQPSADPGCGAPDDGRTMILRARGDFAASESTAQSVELGQAASFSIDRFPATTRLLELEVRGFGGALRTIGRSDLFDIEGLETDAQVPVFMAPQWGVCPTGPRTASRKGALLAGAGRGVLIVGGVLASGEPAESAEFYEPSLGSFISLDDTLYGQGSPQGLVGATLSTLSDGRVVLVGGAATAFQVYSPNLGAFGAPAFYREARARHAAVALADNRVFLAGGCSQLLGSDCVEDAALRTSSLLDVDSGELTPGPVLALERIGGSAFVEGTGVILLAGGEDATGTPVTVAERVFLDGRPSQLVDGVAGTAVQAESGAVWLGLAAGEQLESNALAVIAPGMQAARTGLSAAFADASATLISLQDGSLLALGNSGAQRIRSLDGAAEDLRLEPLRSASGLQAIRLADGSVLVLAGQDEQASDAAFILRPPLVGPFSASASASFSSLALSEGLSARDAGAALRSGDGGDHLTLEVGSEGREWLLVAGPHWRALDLQAGVATERGAITILLGWLSPSNHWKVRLAAGQDAALTQVVDGVELERGGCTSKRLSAEALSGAQGSHEVEASVRDERLQVAIDGAEVLNCEVRDLSEGRAGIGIEGQPGDSLRLDIISLGR